MEIPAVYYSLMLYLFMSFFWWRRKIHNSLLDIPMYIPYKSKIEGFQIMFPRELYKMPQTNKSIS
jgi:hypothetical protein